ncbi:carbonic anhydrase [Stagonosporopsis vannaccii]|nr:carbonic anhydrase [Stagonosporopsis vannaccii]
MFLSISTCLLAVLSVVLGCADHLDSSHFTAPLHNQKRQLTTIDTGRKETFWRYDASYDWGKIDPTYGMCQNGTRQSPIALSRAGGLSNYHQPTFDYEGKNMTGNFVNWGHGPAFTLYHPEGDFSGLPKMVFEDGGEEEEVFLIGWHIHSPADHTVDGYRSKSEMHLVHANAEGDPRAVVAIRIDPGKADSAFISSFPKPFIGFNDTTAYSNTQLDLFEPLREVTELTEFWTYKGSLTSPPCEEGIRWFVARTVMYVGVEQMREVLHVSTFSARVEQQVWQHDINV